MAGAGIPGAGPLREGLTGAGPPREGLIGDDPLREGLYGVRPLIPDANANRVPTAIRLNFIFFCFVNICSSLKF